MDSAPRYTLRWSIVALFVVGGCLALPWDVSLAEFFRRDSLPGELRSLIHKTEFFGHGYGILGIAFTIYLLDERRRRQLPRLLAGALCAGLMCDVIKLMVHRIRPVDFSFAEGASTFVGWSFLHAESWGQIFDSAYHSFPSAHTATSVAFAMGLGWMYPKGARWFLVLSAMVAVSRFDGGAHYVSDTLVGALVGYGSGCWLLSNSSVGRWFGNWELGRASRRWRPFLRPNSWSEGSVRTT